MDQATLEQLTTSLRDYNPTAYKMMENTSTSLERVAIYLLLLFMGLEIFSWYQHLKSDDSKIGIQLFAELAIKYLVAYLLIINIDLIADSLSWLFNVTIKIAAKNGLKSYQSQTPEFKGLGIITKGFFQAVYWVVDFVAQVGTKLLILLRSTTLYVYKGIAKIIVAFFMMDALRSICFNFFKLYLAAFLQGLILIIVIILYPAIVTDDLLAIATKGAHVNAIISIAKGIIYIILLFSSQRMAKTLMQVN